MIGNLFYYADQDADCPADADCARHSGPDRGSGMATRLPDHDVFLKVMLRRTAATAMAL
ncbi:MAG: hypothetical protein U1E55_03095 [Paracoccus sp. (in: a-proteobacteria)]